MKSSISQLKFFYFTINAIEKPYTTARILENEKLSCLSLQQYPVGDSHNISNGMRAADGSEDTLGLREKAPSRGMRYLVNITSKYHAATRNTSSPSRTHIL